MGKRIKPLEPPDSIHLNAAEGWLELGNRVEAFEELEQITPEFRVHPDVLEVRWQINAAEKKWDACIDTARDIIKLDPTRASGWIHLAYSTRRAKKGGLEEAWAILSGAADNFPKVSIIPYNLACYACQLGNLKEARQWLEKAFALGGSKQLKRMALDDPDLEPLRKEIGKI
jgi:tetratricopeptide (TPR) repeat protein